MDLRMGPKRTPEETAELRESLIEHGLRLVHREGAAALTMRALAAEARCSVGLPYKVFENREAVVRALVHEEFRRLMAALERWIAEAGESAVGKNLGRYARLVLGSPAVALATDLGHEPSLAHTVEETATETGVVPALEDAVRRYLEAEKRFDRLAPEVDEGAYAFLIAGAVHNLLMSGEAYPKPEMERIEQLLQLAARPLVRRSPRG